MKALILPTRTVRRRPAYLGNVLMGCNPTRESRWAARSGYSSDIARVSYVEGDWTVGCNFKTIGPGTVCWFVRMGLGFPPLAGFMVCTDEPRFDVIDDGSGHPVIDPSGNPLKEWFVPGHIHGWNRKQWVPGEELTAAGWPPSHAPWGDKRQFRNGQRLDDMFLQIVLSVITPAQARDVALEVHAVTGAYPGWWI